MRKIKFIVVALAALFLQSVVLAQNIDFDKMNRDLKIMENVMSEMFAPSQNQPKSRVFSMSGMADDTKSLYVPNFGVILEYSASNTPIFLNVKDTDKNSSEIDEEQAIKEFFRNYATNINQLKDTDKITLVYASNKGKKIDITTKDADSSFSVSDLSSLSDLLPSDITSITVLNKSDKSKTAYTVSVKDLNAFKTGKISENEVNKRIAKKSTDKKENVDIKVLTSVLETLINEYKIGNYPLNPKVDYIELPGMGVLYNLNMNANIYAGSLNRFVVDTRRAEAAEAIKKAEEELARIRGIRGLNTSDTVQVGTGKVTITKKDINVEKDAKTDENTKKEIDELVSKIKEYVLDIGKTIQSIDANESIVVSLNLLKSTTSNLPNRVDIQAQKSDLNAYSQNKLNRQQALEKIKVTEY